MFPPERILFPTDFSACAEGAYRHAADLADRLGAEVHVLHIVEDPSAPPRQWPEAPVGGPPRVSAADVADDLGLPDPREPDVYAERVPVVEEEVVGPPADAILAYVDDEDIDLLVIGTHGVRGWRRDLLGSVAGAVVRRAPCPVLAVRPLEAPGDQTWPPTRVLHALDAAPGDAEIYAQGVLPAASRWAAGLAAAYRVPLDLLHVAEPTHLAMWGDEVTVRARQAARHALETLADALRSEAETPLKIAVHVRTADAAADAVRAVASETRASLLVVGTHGRRGVGRVVAGSVAEALVRAAPCPVLVARVGVDGGPPPASAEPAPRRATPPAAR